MTKNCPDCNRTLTILQSLYAQDSPYLYPATIWKCLTCKIELIELIGNKVSPQPLKNSFRWATDPRPANSDTEKDKVDYKEYQVLKTINKKFIVLEKPKSSNQV